MSETSSWQQLLGKPAAGHHIAQLYRDEEQLIETVSHYAAEGLRQGDAVILVVTPAHWASLVDRLEARPEVDLSAAVLRGQLRILDAKITLSGCMLDGEPAQDCFQEAVGNEVRRTGERYQSTRIFGEMVDLLWQQGHHSAASSLEEFWNDLAGQLPFSLLCAYQVDQQDTLAYDATRQCACKTHSHLLCEVGHSNDIGDGLLYAEVIQ
jgi:hypothetical protein